MTAAWDALAALYPDARDRDRRTGAAGAARAGGDRSASTAISASSPPARGWWYVSPIAEEWITEANYAA